MPIHLHHSNLFIMPRTPPRTHPVPSLTFWHLTFTSLPSNPLLHDFGAPRHGQNRRPRLAGRMAVFDGNSPNPCLSSVRSAETLELAWLWFTSSVLRASKFTCDENYCKFEINLSSLRIQKGFLGLTCIASLTDFYSEEFALEKFGHSLENPLDWLSGGLKTLLFFRNLLESRFWN